MAAVDPRSDAEQAPVSRVRHIWSVPTLRELPKLTQLTLASAIGGGGGTGGGGSTVFALLLAIGLGAGACTTDRGVSGGPSDLPAPVGQLLTCTADRAALTIDCSSPEAAPGTVILGGQGRKVALRSSGVTYDGGTGILSANITIQNLGASAIGTLDGTTPSLEGLRVFFVSGPDASPAGTVTVNNPTGIATFLSGATPYFEWTNVMLAPQATSAPKSWEFLFAGGATSFTFSVMLSTDVPAAGGIALWAMEVGFGDVQWQSIRGWGTDGLTIIGDAGQAMVRDSGTWRAKPDPLGKGLTAARPTGSFSASEIYSLVDNSGTNEIRYWDGISWRNLLSFAGAPNPAFLVNRLLVRGHNDMFAYGFRFYQWNGSTWTDRGLPPSGGNDRVSVATTLGGNVLGVDRYGAVWQWNNTNWTQVIATTSGQTRNPSLILASDLNHVWVFDVGFPYVEVKYWDGTSWTAPALPNTLANGYQVVAGTVISASDVYVVAQDGAGFGYIWHWDGTSWSQVRNVINRNFNDIWARSATEIYVAGSKGMVEVGDGAGNWTPVVQPMGGGTSQAVRMIGPDQAYIGTTDGKVVRYDGTAWSEVANPGGTINSIWAWGGNAVWVAHFNFDVWHYDGSSWSIVPMPHVVNAVGGWAPGDVWAVGNAGAVSRYNGTSWNQVVAANTDLGSGDLDAVWAGSALFAVAVGQNGTIGMWDGVSWTAPTSPTSARLKSVSGSSDTDVWAVGEFGVALHWDGTNWTQFGVGSSTLTGVWAASPTEVYAVSQSGVVYLYNGTSWSAMTLPPLAGAQNFAQIHGWPNGRALITGTRVLRGYR